MEEKLKEAKRLYELANDDQKHVLETLFPELSKLRESEYERIRKNIISWLKNIEGQTIPINDYNSAIDWLEKQGEKPIGIRSRHATGKLGKLIKDIESANKVEPKDYNSIDPHFCKPIDKVEPKFHEGDWIVFNGLTLYIKEVVNGFYRTISKGGIPNSYDWDIDNVARLWTIADAKDGDVLACKSGWTCIFKTLVDNETFSSYCFMDSTKWFCETGSENHTNTKFMNTYHGEIKPATKEQCRTLMKVMNDAGYLFDFEKKELKEIEQPKLTEFEDAIKDMMNDYRDAIDEHEATIEEVKEHAAYLLSLIPQKSAWSEEDEDFFNDTITFLKDSKNALDHVDWLKSLKYRVQPKVELTQLDKNILEAAIAFVEQNNHFNYWLGVDKHTVLSALHSLRPQNTWKPSDEQMNILFKYAEQNNKDGSILTSLYQDLKKLREKM